MAAIRLGKPPGREKPHGDLCGLLRWGLKEKVLNLIVRVVWAVTLRHMLCLKETAAYPQQFNPVATLDAGNVMYDAKRAILWKNNDSSLHPQIIVKNAPVVVGSRLGEGDTEARGTARKRIRRQPRLIRQYRQNEPRMHVVAW